MFHGIASHGGPARSQGLQPQRHGQPPRVRARAEVLDAEVSRTGALQVTTDDGDTVSISFAALEQLHAESFRGEAGGARAAYGSRSQSSNVAIGIDVEGSLDTEEVADITNLIQQLSQTIRNPETTPGALQLGDGGSLESLNAFQFSYQEQVQVDYSSSRMHATA